MGTNAVSVFAFRMQMFIWNNIFFSLGFDVKDHYKDFGGDAAAYAAPVSHCYLTWCLDVFLIVHPWRSKNLLEIT